MIRPSRSRMFSGAAVVIVAAAVGVGLWQLGSPAAERERRLDERRIADLRAIEGAINAFWRTHDRLPSSLEELSAETQPEIVVDDPVTGDGYGYTPADDAEYDLCAKFDAEDAGRGPIARDAWAHGAGTQCFRLTAGRRLR